MKVKNCLIFGGSGQIGRFLIRKLTQNNYRVTVVTRNIHQKSYIIKTYKTSQGSGVDKLFFALHTPSRSWLLAYCHDRHYWQR